MGPAEPTSSGAMTSWERPRPLLAPSTPSRPSPEKNKPNPNMQRRNSGVMPTNYPQLGKLVSIKPKINLAVNVRSSNNLLWMTYQFNDYQIDMKIGALNSNVGNTRTDNARDKFSFPTISLRPYLDELALSTNQPCETTLQRVSQLFNSSSTSETSLNCFQL